LAKTPAQTRVVIYVGPKKFLTLGSPQTIKNKKKHTMTTVPWQFQRHTVSNDGRIHLFDQARIDSGPRLFLADFDPLNGQVPQVVSGNGSYYFFVEREPGVPSGLVVRKVSVSLGQVVAISSSYEATELLAVSASDRGDRVCLLYFLQRTSQVRIQLLNETLEPVGFRDVSVQNYTPIYPRMLSAQNSVAAPFDSVAVSDLGWLIATFSAPRRGALALYQMSHYGANRGGWYDYFFDTPCAGPSCSRWMSMAGDLLCSGIPNTQEVYVQYMPARVSRRFLFSGFPRDFRILSGSLGYRTNWGYTLCLNGENPNIYYFVLFIDLGLMMPFPNGDIRVYEQGPNVQVFYNAQLGAVSQNAGQISYVDGNRLLHTIGRVFPQAQFPRGREMVLRDRHMWSTWGRRARN
jgi:hypothetical protein